MAVTMTIGNPSVSVDGQQLQAGQSKSWSDGNSQFSVTQGSDGKVTETAKNSATGASMTTTVDNGGQGLDVHSSGSNVKLGGYLTHLGSDSADPLSGGQAAD